MKGMRPVLLGFSLIAFAGAASIAGNDAQAQAGKQQSQPQSQQSRSALPVSKLKDMKVVSAEGEDVGKISDIVLDLNSHRVQAVVLQSGGFFGVGGDNYAFPMSDFKPGKEKDQLTLNLSKDQLENKKGFAKGEWPGMDDEYWSQTGSGAATGGTQSQAGAGKLNLVRASELEGRKLQDKSGKEVGEVKDVIVGLNDGRMRNLVVDVKDGGQATIPAGQLSRGTGDTLVVGMDAQQIRAQAKQSGGSKAGSGASSSKSSRQPQK